MTEEQEISTRGATVTCHTEGCTNAEHAIALDVQDVPEPQVSCGVCGQPITDIK